MKILWLLCLIVTSFVCLSQTVAYNNPTKKNHKPSRHIFHATAEPSTLAKLNLSSMCRSDYSVCIEQKLGKHFSTEISPGFTHYLHFTETADFFNYRPNNYVLIPRDYKTSFSMKAAFRYYFSKAGRSLYGPYLGTEIMYRQYNYSVYVTSSKEHSLNESSLQKEIRVLYGVQNKDIYRRFFYDCAIGIGYRNHERTYLGYSEPSKFSTQQIFNNQKNYLVFIISIKTGLAIF